MVDTTRYSSTWQALRVAGFSSFVRDTAFLFDLDLDIQVEKGLLLERGRFRVSGPPEKVNQFIDAWLAACNDYNSRMTA